MAAHGTKHIIQSLLVNLVIAGSKGVGAVITGSGALLAETLHSAADCANQGLLLLGVKSAQRPPDTQHPMGYGRALYFWSFIVALLLFSGGGVFSIYEGIHKLQHPEPPENVWVGIVILAVSLALEGAATFGNIRELNRRRGPVPFAVYLRRTKDSDLVVVFGENAAATSGLFFALVALVLAHQTGDGRWDAAGSLVIGVILVAVAVFLAIEIKSLLMGESADSGIEEAARTLVTADPKLQEILELITVQQGPGEVMVAMKIRLAEDISSREVVECINAFEAALRERCPEVEWCFVEPDSAA